MPDAQECDGRQSFLSFRSGPYTFFLFHLHDDRKGRRQGDGEKAGAPVRSKCDVGFEESRRHDVRGKKLGSGPGPLLPQIRAFQDGRCGLSAFSCRTGAKLPARNAAQGKQSNCEYKPAVNDCSGWICMCLPLTIRSDQHASQSIQCRKSPATPRGSRNLTILRVFCSPASALAVSENTRRFHEDFQRVIL